MSGIWEEKQEALKTQYLEKIKIKRRKTCLWIGFAIIVF
jgi:hypothetical protein